MDPNGPDTPTLTPTVSHSGSTLSRKSSVARLKPHKQRSNASLRPSVPSTPVDDETFTSFPKLSPSLEASPEIFSTAFSQHRAPGALSSIDTNSITTNSSLAVPRAFEELFTPSTPVSATSALFDDTPRAVRDVPGTLHHQSDDHVKRLIAKTGAIALVKQLAQDLAERDEQMTLLQRRAEEREALLRKMLRECEVSNMDIENRLRDLRRSNHDRGGQGGKKTANGIGHGLGSRPEATINERMLEAFQDQIQVDRSAPRTPTDQTKRLDEADDFETPRANRKQSTQSTDTASTTSLASTRARPAGTVRGWKDYFKLAADTSGAESSQVDGGLSPIDNLQGPPLSASAAVGGTVPHPLGRSTSRASIQQDFSNAYRGRNLSNTDSDAASASHGSMAGWVTKLVGGTQHSAKQGRSRAASTGANTADTLSRRKSIKSLRINTNNPPVKGDTAIAALSRSATVRRVAKDPPRPSVVGLAPPNPVDTNGDAIANLGPVEMDTIISEEKRPPTLSHYNNYGASADYLTDRFGFIYDQRRRKRQDAAAAALPSRKRTELAELRNALQPPPYTENDAQSQRSRSSSMRNASRPDTPASTDGQTTDPTTKRWQDYLKLSNFRTELLSHTPYAEPITRIMTPEAPLSDTASKQGSQITVSKNGTAPAQSTNPTPSPTRVFSGNAELAVPSTLSGTTFNIANGNESESIVDPVKALLDQVNDVHDTLQREKTTRWNDFLRKVRAERRRDKEALIASGNHPVSKITPEMLLADGEMIGVAGLGLKGKLGRAKGTEFRNLVLNGIPVAYRAKIWAECCGASSLRAPGYYDELVNSDFTDPDIAQQIQMDITRTLTDNIFFRKGQGVAKLNEVLLAYARRNPVVGYCQGMNLVTANLLLIMPTAEDAFWILTSIMETILPEKYYDSSLLTSRADQQVLRQYVAEVLPQLSAHLESLSIDLEAVTFQWFLSLFTDCLSAEALFRVWDVIFCLNDGATFLFQVALALLKLNEKSLLACDNPGEVYGYISQKMTDHAISIDGLIRASEGLKGQVKREDTTDRRDKVVQQEEETKRERERIRKGKGRAVGDGSNSATSSPSRSGPRGLGLTLDTSAGAQTLPRGSSYTTKTLSSKSSRADFSADSHQDSGADGWTNSLQIRTLTPMPIDEEFMWRG